MTEEKLVKSELVKLMTDDEEYQAALRIVKAKENEVISALHKKDEISKSKPGLFREPDSIDPEDNRLTRDQYDEHVRSLLNIEYPEEKQERSLPFTARVNIVSLAELAKYWTNEGYQLRSVSQLISWIVEMAKDILVQEGVISPTLDFISAKQLMTDLGLTQASHEKRWKKAATATRFAMMRKEGYDPRTNDPHSYKVVHNKHSIEPAPIQSRSSDEEAYQRARLEKQRELHELYIKERDAKMQVYKDKGFISESKIEDVDQRDKELSDSLNSLTLEDMLKSKE